MLRLASVAAFLTLVIAAPASADSIAYVKGGDVWLATPDGARQQQVTHTGTYSYVSQADDGTMIAAAPGRAAAQALAHRRGARRLHDLRLRRRAR